MNNIKIVEKELFFLKEEQKYLENKLNILGASISATNSLIFLGITNFKELNFLNFVGVILTLLFPIGCFLFGLLPSKTFFIKKFQYEEDKKYNFFSREKEYWNQDNIIAQMNYQIDICLKVIQRKNKWVCYTIITEFCGVILSLLFLFLI
ncbi:hypothetical protein [Spiroplasma endosymbiont of Cantharis lateralis]|uniref:hypothetical protein n=1 Tax=Spiroplasma endosymbiont of Cantharis lateralis TaxID=3066277 RepID=UPI00313BD208